MSEYVFHNEEFLYLLGLIPVLVFWYIFRLYGRNAAVKLPVTSFLKKEAKPLRFYLQHVLFGLRMVAMALFIIALARPQSTSKWSETLTEGIDITLCMDVSGSMQAMDFSPNRLSAAKEVATEFVSSRPADRFALVVFSGESFTLCPITSDRAVILNQIRDISFGMIEDGTAIGMGLSTSVSRLKDSMAKSKVIILLTDGVNNTGAVGPLTAAEMAAEFGIRVYTIGVGTRGTAPMPARGVFGQQSTVQVPVEIDEEVLEDIAHTTGGQYFRATDKESLRNIYAEIDQMEKTILDTQNYTRKHEEYFRFLLAGLLILLAELVSRYTVMRNIP